MTSSDKVLLDKEHVEALLREIDTFLQGDGHKDAVRDAMAPIKLALAEQDFPRPHSVQGVGP